MSPSDARVERLFGDGANAFRKAFDPCSGSSGCALGDPRAFWAVSAERHDAAWLFNVRDVGVPPELGDAIFSMLKARTGRRSRSAGGGRSPSLP